MKSFLTRVGLFVLTAALIVGAAGCAKNPKNLTPLPTGRAGGSAPTGDVPVDNGAGTGTGTGTGVGPGAGRLKGGDAPVTPTDFTGANNPANNVPKNGADGLGNLNPADKVEDRTKFAADTIYFDFDKSNVKPEYANNVRDVADYLKGHTGESILIEGHCDERGTEEYNRALGERRALAVREKLLASGVSTDQITTISYGEEKPAELGQTEAAYAKNRRAVFVLLLTPAAAR